MEFDLIKTQLQKFSLGSVLENSFIILNEIQKSEAKYPFWNVLILIKWALLYSDESTVKTKAIEKDIQDILLLIDDFEKQRQVIDFKIMDAKTGLRILAYQQFWHQDHISNHTFDRQLALYVKVNTTFDINLEFKKIVGIDIITFLSLCYLVFIYISYDKLGGEKEYDGILENDLFIYLKERFSDEEILIFLNLLTVKSKSDVINIQKMTDEGYQMYETNFLTTKPFIFLNNKFIIPHRAVFGQTAKNFIYNFMKINCDQFSTELGQKMERYIEFGLNESSISYLTEGSLKRKYKLKKVVDFLVDDIVLIECKAVDLNPRTAILRNTEILNSDFKSSIVKSYKQLLSTAHQIDPSKSWYGIVVTYKDTYIGFGVDGWSDFLEKPISEFIQDEGISLSVLPPNKLCFIDIESWDYLMQAVKEKKGSFIET